MARGVTLSPNQRKRQMRIGLARLAGVGKPLGPSGAVFLPNQG